MCNVQIVDFNVEMFEHFESGINIIEINSIYSNEKS